MINIPLNNFSVSFQNEAKLCSFLMLITDGKMLLLKDMQICIWWSTSGSPQSKKKIQLKMLEESHVQFVWDRWKIILTNNSDQSVVIISTVCLTSMQLSKYSNRIYTDLKNDPSINNNKNGNLMICWKSLSLAKSQQDLLIVKRKYFENCHDTWEFT